MRVILTSVVVAIFMTAVVSATPLRHKLTPGAEPIKIATAGPMTGQYKPFGQQMKTGAAQAIADINANGGVLGRKLVLEAADDHCNSATAAAVARRLADEKTAFVAGHFCSGSSIPASKVYAGTKVVEISPASTNPQYTDERAGPGIFRLAGRDDVQGKFAGAYIVEHFKDKKVAILDDKSRYGKGLAEQTRKTLNSAGIAEEMNESYDTGGKDYSALVAKLKAADIGVVYVAGYHAETGLIVREMRKQGVAAQLIGGDALVTNEYWQIAGKAGEGTLMSFIRDPRRIPAAAAVVREFRRKGIDPEGYILDRYAAVQVWAEAAEKAGSIDFDAVVKELANNTFPAVIGDVSFDGLGNSTVPYYVMYVWHHGRYSRQ